MKGFTTERGFTLIETMIAVTILTLAVAGPLFTASRAIVSAEIARDRLTASYLAQEGIEYVRAMRDNEYLISYQTGGTDVSNAAWTNFLTGTGSGSIVQCRVTALTPGQACALDPTLTMGTGPSLSILACPDSACTTMPLRFANGVYTLQSSGSWTPFTRVIQVFDVPGTESDKRVVSKVSWDFHGTTYAVSITDHLTPWQ